MCRRGSHAYLQSQYRYSPSYVMFRAHAHVRHVSDWDSARSVTPRHLQGPRLNRLTHRRSATRQQIINSPREDLRCGVSSQRRHGQRAPSAWAGSSCLVRTLSVLQRVRAKSRPPSMNRFREMARAPGTPPSRGNLTPVRIASVMGAKSYRNVHHGPQRLIDSPENPQGK
jgi:hypothetical protein